MIWNTIKQFLYCGIFHKTEITEETASHAWCKCGTEYEKGV